MCAVLLPPGVNPIAVDKYIISYRIFCKQDSVCRAVYLSAHYVVEQLVVSKRNGS